MELCVLLLEGFHASLEMYFQPLPALNGEELHTLRYVATFIYATNDISKGVFTASPKVRFPTGSTIVVGNVASAESELTYAIVDGCFLESIGGLLLKKHWPNNLFNKLTPELRAFFLCLIEGKVPSYDVINIAGPSLLGHANDLHIMQINNIVFHISSSFYLMTLRRYGMLLELPNIWDILYIFVISEY